MTPSASVTWSVEKLIRALSETGYEDTRILVFKYQRNLVWNEEKQAAFIDSLKRGWPIGALLLHKRGHRNGLDEYSIIDGLQRTNTLKEYYENPNRYIFGEDIPAELPERILETLGGEVTAEATLQVRTSLVEWVRARPGFGQADGYSAFELYQAIVPGGDIKGFSTLNPLLSHFLDSWRRNTDISGIQIPIMIFSGSEHDLPVIFERINSGTALTKYQKFAATWSPITFELKDANIIRAIGARYDALRRQGYAIERYDPSEFAHSDFTLFEYLFGFGKYLGEKYPHLFETSRKPDEEDTIGFNLFCACVGLRAEDMAKLPEEMGVDTPESIQPWIMWSVQFVHSCLWPVIGLKANSQSRTPIYHAENQVVSFIALVYHLRFRPEFASSWSTYEPLLRRHIPLWYLYDIIRRYWRGPVEKKLYDIVSAGPNAPYLTPLTRQDWRSVLNEWFRGQLQTRSSFRRSAPKESILFLKYIYAHVVSYYENHTATYDCDHLIPYERLKRAESVVGKPLPASHVANLVLLAYAPNREKKDKTLQEFVTDRVAAGRMTKDEADEAFRKYRPFYLEDPAEILIPKVGNEDRITYEYFLQKFIEPRCALLIDRFFEANPVPGE